MRTKSGYKLFCLMSITLPMLFVTGCSSNGGSNSVDALITKVATLTGIQEVPAVTNTTATGSGRFVVDPKTRVISGSVTTKDLTGTVAHIHTGVVGVSGPPVVMLAETTTGSGVWEVPAGTVLSIANYELFLNGGLYVNVHSSANPKGEIRGQISSQ
ncbi:MAG: CHRD domain-containing protein [Candidatus Nitrotoga sp.]